MCFITTLLLQLPNSMALMKGNSYLLVCFLVYQYTVCQSTFGQQYSLENTQRGIPTDFQRALIFHVTLPFPFLSSCQHFLSSCEISQHLQGRLAIVCTNICGSHIAPDLSSRTTMRPLFLRTTIMNI